MQALQSAPQKPRAKPCAKVPPHSQKATSHASEGLALAIAIGVGLHPASTGGALPESGSQPACTIADTELFPLRGIDNSPCGLDGSGDGGHNAQNRAKNNLCAGGVLTANPQEEPAFVTQLSFRRLQAAADDIREAHDLGVQGVPKITRTLGVSKDDFVYITKTGEKDHRRILRLVEGRRDRSPGDGGQATLSNA